MKTLEKYRKNETKAPPKQTYSVFLETRQVEFIRKHSLNLSRLVRDILEKLISEDKPKAKK